jgi:hypothetical protein
LVFIVLSLGGCGGECPAAGSDLAILYRSGLQLSKRGSGMWGGKQRDGDNKKRPVQGLARGSDEKGSLESYERVFLTQLPARFQYT